MEEFLSRLESSLGVPADLLERAAAARAGASGSSADAVVRSWAGSDAGPAAEPAIETAAPQATAPQATAPDVASPDVAAAVPEVEVLEAVEPAVEEAPMEDEAPGPASTLAGFPAWLAAALVAIPVLALSYVLIAPNGPGCGSSGQLAIDAETGLAENCDGTAYGVEVVDFFTMGRDVFEGNGACAACHGVTGGGVTGPAFANGAVLVTFPANSCSDHLNWVSIGSANWPDPTYGATGTVVGSSGAIMPGFADALTPEELAAVVLYERVAFGGQAVADAEGDCGLIADGEVTAGR